MFMTEFPMETVRFRKGSRECARLRVCHRRACGMTVGRKSGSRPAGRGSTGIQPEAELLGPRGAEQTGVISHGPERFQLEPAARGGKALSEDLRERSRAAHSRTEPWVVVAPAPQVVHERHHMLCTQGMTLREPVAKKVLHLVG